MNERMAQALKIFLRGIERQYPFQNMKTVVLGFQHKGLVYVRFGVEYDNVEPYGKCHKVTRGEAKESDLQIERRYCLLGTREDWMKKQTKQYCNKAVFRLPNDDGDWFYGGGWDGVVSYPWHPLGPTMYIHRWPHESPDHGRIDRFYDAPAERHNVTVEYI